MKLICKLEKIVDTVSSTGETWAFTYVPEKEAYEKNVKLVISGPNCLQVLENLELPYEQGDLIEIDLKPKQTQSKLNNTTPADMKKTKKAKKGAYDDEHMLDGKAAA